MKFRKFLRTVWEWTPLAVSIAALIVAHLTSR